MQRETTGPPKQRIQRMTWIRFRADSSKSNWRRNCKINQWTSQRRRDHSQVLTISRKERSGSRDRALPWPLGVPRRSSNSYGPVRQRSGRRCWCIIHRPRKLQRITALVFTLRHFGQLRRVRAARTELDCSKRVISLSTSKSRRHVMASDLQSLTSRKDSSNLWSLRASTKNK